MGKAVVTIKIMPESPDVDLESIQSAAVVLIDEFLGSSHEKRVEIEPVAFGLKAVKILFVMDESKGSPDSLEEAISGLDGVQSAQVVDVRRAMG